MDDIMIRLLENNAVAAAAVWILYRLEQAVRELAQEARGLRQDAADLKAIGREVLEAKRP